MTQLSAGEPLPRSAGARSPRRGLLAGLVTALVVAYPLLWVLSLSHAGFSGCWIGCGEPSPADGILWAVVGAVLMSLPVVSGMQIAGVRSWRARVGAVLLVALVIGAWVLFSLDPDNARFFVAGAPGV